MLGYSLMVPILFLNDFSSLQIHNTSFVYQMKFLDGLLAMGMPNKIC